MPKTEADIETLLQAAIPHRLYALYAMSISIDLRIEREERHDSGAFRLVINGKTRAEGNAAGVIDPWLEIGIVHGRAILEFLGLGANGQGSSLIETNARQRESDWRISDLGLPLVTPKQAIGAYKGKPDEAEESLLSILVSANRSIAHVTEVLPERFSTANLQIAARGIHALVTRYVYDVLGRKSPKWGTPGL